jgi:hypothetical protein
MNTATIEKTRIILKRDSDGVVYAIPETLEEQFISLDEAVQNAEFMSQDWHRALDELNGDFAGYKKLDY